MDSPVRKMQKRNDYNRHKLFRKIRRRRRAQAEQLSRVAEKELKKKLRVTPVKYGGGKVDSTEAYMGPFRPLSYAQKFSDTLKESVQKASGHLKQNQAVNTAKKLSKRRSSTVQYIGGNAEQVREKFWKQEPVLDHAVDSIASEYDIDPEMLKYRINKEGFVDGAVRLNNILAGKEYKYSDPGGYSLLHSPVFSGPGDFGLDDYAYYVQNGAHPINENWETVHFENEKNRSTAAATGITVADNMGMVASLLRYFAQQAKQDYPSLSDYDLNRYALAYYNLGQAGGRKWAENGAKGYEFRPKGFMLMPQYTYRGGKTTGYVREENDNPVAFDEEGNLVDQVTGDKGTMYVPEVTISPSRYTRDLYSSAFDPNAPIEFVNAMTAGGLNNLSPTQWIRRAYDTVGFINGDMSQGLYIGSWINGNNGIVTNNFAQEHPYWSTGINMIGDALAMGIGSQASKLPKYRRLERNFTGVPHKQVEINGVPQFDSSGKPIYMDESFPSTHNQHTVWTSNDVDYATNGTWSQSRNNPVFDVYTDPKVLKTLDTPTPAKGDMYWWAGLPFDLQNGKVILSNELKHRPNGIPRTKDISIKNGGVNGKYTQDDFGRYVHKEGQESPLIFDWEHVPGAVKTDKVVGYSKEYGYDATRFHNVFDGSSYIGGGETAFNYPVDELVLNPGTEKYILPHGTPKWKVFNQLPANPIFKNPVSYLGAGAYLNQHNGSLSGYKNGKTSSGIHIKPSHRGRLTALKKRTGKSEAELYRTGSAATRKMITFARNARKWNK